MITSNQTSFSLLPVLVRKLFLPLFLPAILFVCSASGQQHPNIVVILADDMGFGDVGFDGSPDIPTPNIDALAHNGVQCTDGYVTEPFCSPSRAAILTGRYQQRFGYDVGPENDNANPILGLPATETTLAELLKPAGYVTGAIGKWHLGTAPSVFPTARGFDEFVGFLDAQAKYYNTTLYRGNTEYVETAYLTDAFTREAVSFIDNHAAQPFFLYLAYNAVHAPYDVPPQQYLDRVSYIQNAQRRNYAAMAVALDDGVGKVIQSLQDNNLLNNTLIFFLSDNGAPSGGATKNSNLPLSGYKTNVLEGGIHIPYAVQWSSHLPPGTIFHAPVSSLDIFATAAAAAGVELPTDRAYDGINILPYFSGDQPDPNRNLFWRYFGLGPDGPLGSLRTIWAVRSGSLKLVTERDEDDQPPALYNLTQDLGETNDLAAKEPDQVSSLLSLYQQWELNDIPSVWQRDSDTALLPLVLAGDWNGFNKNDTGPPWTLTLLPAPDLHGAPDGYNWITGTIHVASAGGDTTPGIHTFTIVGTEKYSLQWGGVTINIDNVTDIPSYSGSTLGPRNTITLDNNYYYSFRLIDTHLQPTPGLAMTLAVMKTSGPPIAVRRTSQSPAHPAPTKPITVNIVTSKTKSPEERIYVRWSNDSFITSHMVSATGSGRNFSAVIPGQPAGVSVLYTVMSSTADLTSYTTSASIDQLTLAVNGVFNAVPPIAPAITKQPVSKSVNLGQRAKFQVRATGTDPLRYQWRKNGTDIPGATGASYTTPPTTQGDDGTLFSVVVSNPAARAISNSATLSIR